ncbi:MAG: 2,3-bisphosphoglycerate-independent phosphoglycerate mutase [Candidatus Aenigmarchaeota archaeon]|nr:2,3-bisphosphoglycerate-independent phosphoglycerate mutase [Candidatus Aenigmarchaeota archaeon]
MPLSKNSKKPVVLIIRDGWGINEIKKGNALLQTKTPNMDYLLGHFPNCTIAASGTDVGLPYGCQGSSEVGHMNMGAGRIVVQELKRINDEIQNNSVAKKKKFIELVEKCRNNNSSLHLIGLVQDEGVHAHQSHLFGILKILDEIKFKQKIYIHFFTDGRDTPPRSSLEYAKMLEDKINEYSNINCSVATVMGRYYPMDRNKAWNLTDIAYLTMTNPQEALIKKKARKANTLFDAIKISYSNDRTPDDSAMFDEYIFPTIIKDYAGMEKNDCVLNFNFRQDRAIQLTKAFVDENYPGNVKKIKVNYYGFTRYYNEFKNHIFEPMEDIQSMDNLFGEILLKKKIKQLRISETQKFPHVTMFFNGKRTSPFDKNLETWEEIVNKTDQGLLSQTPKMKAYELTEKLLEYIDKKTYDVIVVNFPNGDMIGHTGNFKACRIAVKTIDECVGRIAKKIIEKDAVAIITSDHGNIEEMIDYKTGKTKTSHTTNLVNLIYVAKDADTVKLKRHGKLSDIMPTMMDVLNIKYDLPGVKEELKVKSLIE